MYYSAAKHTHTHAYTHCNGSSENWRKVLLQHVLMEQIGAGSVMSASLPLPLPVCIVPILAGQHRQVGIVSPRHNSLLLIILVAAILFIVQVLKACPAPYTPLPPPPPPPPPPDPEPPSVQSFRINNRLQLSRFVAVALKKRGKGKWFSVFQ